MSRKPKTPLRPILLTVTESQPEALFVSIRQILKKKLPAPQAVKLLTTPRGRHRFMELVRPLETNEILLGDQLVKVSPDDIELFTNAKGVPVESVYCGQGLQDAGDCLLTLIRDLTKDDTTALYLTVPSTSPLASYATLAMSYFARPQDQLFLITHKAAEKAPETIDAAWLDFSGHLRADDDYEVVLLKYALLRDKFRRPTAQREAEREGAAALAESVGHEIFFNLPRSEIVSRSGTRVHMEPTLLAFYYWLADRASRLLPGPNPAAKQAAQEFILVREYVMSHAVRSRQKSTRLDKSAQDILNSTEAFQKFFVEKKAMVNRVLKESLSSAEFKALQIVGVGRRPQQFTVLLKEGDVRVKESRR